ncbi:MAG: toll/interleukin-1 receptor domain-containing protein [Actinobacteria bacterium]|nr:toll/interleukin-1 receptor domain-containing protein [Actinomycetota bacterium]
MERDPETSGRVFISYRREDTAYAAGWLYDRLPERFGEAQIFKDVDSIAPGDDFAETITTAVGSCEGLLALIGNEWLTVTDTSGDRRIDDPTDFVRLEIEAALSRDVRVIPVLVEGARMPRVEELPPSLAKLARRQAMELSPSRFKSDLHRLLEVLDCMVVDSGGTGPSPKARADPSDPVSPGHRVSNPMRRRAVVTAVAVSMLSVLGAVALGLIYQRPFLVAVTALSVWEGVRSGARSHAEQMRRRGFAPPPYRNSYE